jgi:Ribose 5-phosphate isomerase A (phosphoriboisomerase A)
MLFSEDIFSACITSSLNHIGPVVTDNANFILDWFWPRGEERSAKDWDIINTQLQTMPGVLDTGLFVNMAIKVACSIRLLIFYVTVIDRGLHTVSAGIHAMEHFLRWHRHNFHNIC